MSALRRTSADNPRVLKTLGLGYAALAKRGRGQEYAEDAIELLRRAAAYVPLDVATQLQLTDVLYHFGREEVWFGALEGTVPNATALLEEARTRLLTLYKVRLCDRCGSLERRARPKLAQHGADQ
jgi:hypothetical protein